MPSTIKEQSVEQLGSPSSVLARQRRDHSEMDRLMDRCRTLQDGEERERVLKELVQLVFSHAFAEETMHRPRRTGAEPPSAVLGKVLTGLTGLLVSAAVFAILRKRR
jgi:hypothetical protein